MPNLLNFGEFFFFGSGFLSLITAGSFIAVEGDLISSSYSTRTSTVSLQIAVTAVIQSTTLIGTYQLESTKHLRTSIRSMPRCAQPDLHGHVLYHSWTERESNSQCLSTSEPKSDGFAVFLPVRSNRCELNTVDGTL